MFDTYQNEIIAVAVVLVLAIIYFALKKKPSSTNGSEYIEPDLDKKSIKRVNITEKEVKPEIQKNSNTKSFYEELNGSQEGDFGEEITSDNNTICKRAVPRHDKITKQNFSEFSGLRVLVAEDNLINQKVLTGLLAGSGIDIVLASDGKEALDILETDNDFFMILMDAHMPRVDGFKATRIIRKNPRYSNIAVVALSGDTAADDIRKMKEAGMHEQLEKPLRMDSLYDIFYAYSGNQCKEDDCDYVEVIMTKELNGDKGLSVCGGDDEFYHEILHEFISTYENSTQKLGDLLRDEKMKEADQFLLDIIGITANIGAEPLNTIVKDIKSALNDTQEKSYLTLIDQYKIHLEDLIKDIKEYI